MLVEGGADTEIKNRVRTWLRAHIHIFMHTQYVLLSYTGRCVRYTRNTQEGYTALVSAAHGGSPDCVRLLLENGSDKEVQTNVRLVTCHFFKLTLTTLAESIFCLSNYS